MSLLRRNVLLVLWLAVALSAGACAPGGAGPAGPSGGTVVSSIFDADLSARQPRAANRGATAQAVASRRAPGEAIYMGAESSGGGDQTVSSYAPARST
jgi:hypothetical protein